MNGTIGPELWVVVPAYNEAGAIGEVLESLKPHDCRVVVVDDGSSDGTGEVARAAGAAVVRHCLNAGQGAALQTGIDFALRRGARYICTCDADGQHQPGDIPVMLRRLIEEDADVAIGSRFLGSAPDMPWPRRLLLRAGVLFTRLHSRVRLTDTHNGLRLFSRRAAERVRITQAGMAHASEIIDQIGEQKLKYVEVPVTVRYTAYSCRKGQSNWKAFGIVLDLVVGRMLR